MDRDRSLAACGFYRQQVGANWLRATSFLAETMTPAPIPVALAALIHLVESSSSQGSLRSRRAAHREAGVQVQRRTADDLSPRYPGPGMMPTSTPVSSSPPRRSPDNDTTAARVRGSAVHRTGSAVPRLRARSRTDLEQMSGDAGTVSSYAISVDAPQLSGRRSGHRRSTVAPPRREPGQHREWGLRPHAAWVPSASGDRREPQLCRLWSAPRRDARLPPAPARRRLRYGS